MLLAGKAPLARWVGNRLKLESCAAVSTTQTVRRSSSGGAEPGGQAEMGHQEQLRLGRARQLSLRAGVRESRLAPLAGEGGVPSSRRPSPAPEASGLTLPRPPDRVGASLALDGADCGF